MEAGGGSAVRQGGEEGDHLRTIRWKPNEQCLQLLLGMGIDRNSAIKALYYTGNHSAEFAASYVFDNPDMDDELDASLRIDARGESDEDIGEVPHYKMVLVVNGCLSMSVGKTAGQVAHATLGLYRRLAADKQRFGNHLLMWEDEGEKKIILRGEDVSHLKQLEKVAAGMDVPSYLVLDAGRTEIPPDSITVVALFGPEHQINDITGKLPLL